nr:hypothetical protein [Tanacetum cinerariifolium]
MLHISPRIPNQPFADLPTEEEILDFLRNSKAYKEYYACAMGEAAPKPKESARKKKGDSASSTTPPTPTPTTTVEFAPRLSATAKDVGGHEEGKKSDESDDDRDEGSNDDSDETVKAGAGKNDDDDDDEDDDDTDEEEELAKGDEEDKGSGKGGDEVRESEGESDEEETRQEEEESFDPIPRTPKENEGTGSRPGVPDVPSDDSEEEISWNSFDDEDVGGQDEGDKNDESDDGSDEGREFINVFVCDKHAKPDQRCDAPIPSTTIPSIILKNLPTFNSAFRFDERLRSLETSFSEYRQTNSFVDAVSAIPGIVQQYMTQQMMKAVREAVQIQTDRLQDSLQRENDEFLRNINENMKKIIKGQVKNQVKEQVSRILPRIKESVNATLKAEVLTQSSHSSRTSYAIAADLSEMELKKILIEKIEGNKREDDDPEGPSAGSNRGFKRQKEGGEHASSSTPSETTTRGAGRSTTGSQSRQLSSSESAFAEEPVQTTCQMEEPPHLVFEIGADDQPIVQTSQHPEWFSQLRRPPSPDRDWNKTLPAAQGDAQSWISDLARQTDARS